MKIGVTKAAVLVLSLCLNAAGLAFAGKALLDRGGLDYIERRLGLSEAEPAVPFDHKLATLDLMPDLRGEIVFVGDSLTDAFMWAECFPALPVQNHGIGGNRVSDVAARLDRIIDRAPSAIYLNIGTNDIGDRRDPAVIASEIEGVLDRIEAQLPLTRVVLQSIPPRVGVVQSESIVALNGMLAEVAVKRGLEWVDFHDALLGDNGQIDDRFHTDGVHLTAAAYGVWVNAVAETLSTDEIQLLSGHADDLDTDVFESGPVVHAVRRIAMGD
ncbi:MAG: GDSL-type esterase/lipase family protein [Planctomycetota bacterium]